MISMLGNSADKMYHLPNYHKKANTDEPHLNMHKTGLQKPEDEVQLKLVTQEEIRHQGFHSLLDPLLTSGTPHSEGTYTQSSMTITETR